MRDLCEMLSFVLFVAFIGVTVFIFQGEPDLWDKWHAEAMGKCLPGAAK